MDKNASGSQGETLLHESVLTDREKAYTFGTITVNNHKIRLYTHKNGLGFLINCPTWGGELSEPDISTTECYLCEKSIVSNE